MKNSTVAVVILLIVIAGLGIWFYMSPTDNPINDIRDTTDENQNTPATPTNNNTPVTGTGAPVGTPTTPAPTDGVNVKTFTVTGSNFAFSVPEMRAKKGDVVKIIFTSASGMHDLRIDEFGVGTKILRADDPADTLQFAVNEGGTFEYYCTVGNHREMGMVGKLIVTE